MWDRFFVCALFAESVEYVRVSFSTAPCVRFCWCLPGVYIVFSVAERVFGLLWDELLIVQYFWYLLRISGFPFRLLRKLVLWCLPCRESFPLQDIVSCCWGIVAFGALFGVS